MSHTTCFAPSLAAAAERRAARGARSSSLQPARCVGCAAGATPCGGAGRQRLGSPIAARLRPPRRLPRAPASQAARVLRQARARCAPAPRTPPLAFSGGCQASRTTIASARLTRPPLRRRRGYAGRVGAVQATMASPVPVAGSSGTCTRLKRAEPQRNLAVSAAVRRGAARWRAGGAAMHGHRVVWRGRASRRACRPRPWAAGVAICAPRRNPERLACLAFRPHASPARLRRRRAV